MILRRCNSADNGISVASTQRPSAFATLILTYNEVKFYLDARFLALHSSTVKYSLEANSASICQKHSEAHTHDLREDGGVRSSLSQPFEMNIDKLAIADVSVDEFSMALHYLYNLDYGKTKCSDIVFCSLEAMLEVSRYLDAPRVMEKCDEAIVHELSCIKARDDVIQLLLDEQRIGNRNKLTLRNLVVLAHTYACKRAWARILDLFSSVRLDESNSEKTHAFAFLEDLAPDVDIKARHELALRLILSLLCMETDRSKQ